MAWSDLVFTFPAVIESEFDSSLVTLAAANGETDTAKADLNALSFAWEKSPVAEDCSDSESLRENIENIARGECVSCVVHPYIYKRSDSPRDYLHNEMTPPSAIELLLEKTTDINDLHRPEFEAGICLLILGLSETQFAENLNIFNSVFAIDELLAVERRATQLAGLETNKLEDKKTFIAPYFNSTTNENFVNLNDSFSLAQSTNDIARGFDMENTTPKTRLAALMDKKKAYIDQLQSSFDAIKAGFVSGTGKGFYMPEFSRSELSNSSYPGSEYPYCAAVLLLGSEVVLAPLKEAFGL